MEAATKKKRGRPKDEEYRYMERINNNDEHPLSRRAVQNRTNAEALIIALHESDSYSLEFFFMTKEGLLRHNGIAEQIGRMIREGTITNDEAINLAAYCMNEYKSGIASKDIESRLRLYRLNLAAEARADKDQEQME